MHNPIPEYLTNARLLLQKGPRFAMLIDRQVCFQLLPKLRGVRTELEADVLELLGFCLDGPDAQDIGLDRAEAAVLAASQGTNLAGNSKAKFPKGAIATGRVLRTLQEHGVYPEPTLKGSP